MKALRPSSELNIPDEFTLHVNNTFYTESIGIGTEEVVVMEIHFSSVEEARKADKVNLEPTKLLSVYLKYIGRHVAVPKKIKVILHGLLMLPGKAKFVSCSIISLLHGLLMLPGKAKFVSCSIISLGLSF